MAGQLKLGDCQHIRPFARPFFRPLGPPCRRRVLPAIFRERPPGLIQHVLTVLVFWSWVLLLPRLQPSSQSLRLFPWASMDICLDLLPAASRPPVQKRDAQHMFLQHRGGTRRHFAGHFSSVFCSEPVSHAVAGQPGRKSILAKAPSKKNPYFFVIDKGSLARIERLSPQST